MQPTPCHGWRRAFGTAAVAALALSLSITAPSAAAAPIGADGVIQACYKAKGKQKGAVRVVKSTKKCKRKRSERPLSWGIQGPAGPAGSVSPQVLALIWTQQSKIATLETQVSELTDQVSELTDQVSELTEVLQGVTNADLTSVISKLDGITGADLTNLVDALPAIDSLCAQVAALTTRGNDLLAAIGGLSLNGVLTGIGGVLNIPSLPTPLSAYACP